jgi:hypothetical protein
MEGVGRGAYSFRHDSGEYRNGWRAHNKEKE